MRRHLGFLGACLGFTVVLLDTTAVAAILPGIVADLGGGSSAGMWIAAAYLLAFAVLLMPCGTLADRIGPGRAYLLGLVVFGVGSALCAAAPPAVVAAPLSTYPMSTQDVALVVEEAVVAGDVRASLAEGAGELLESVELFDVYRGPGVPEGSKSLAFSLRFRAPDRTLTAEEASEARAAATALAAQRHGAVQR